MRAYLFDFNGVLVDDERVHFAAMRDVLAQRGIALDEPTYFAEYLAYDDVGAFRIALERAGLPHDETAVARCVAEKLPRYMKAVERDLVLFDGAFALVRACAARGPVAIVSGALRVEIDHALQRARAADAITTIVAAEDVAACKPDPEGYVEALRRLGIAGARAVVVEDSAGGIVAARAAGCTVVGVAHTLPADELTRAGASLVVPHIRELLPDALDALREARP